MLDNVIKNFSEDQWSEFMEQKAFKFRPEYILLKAIGLSLKKREDVYRAVCRLVWNRINKAQSV